MAQFLGKGLNDIVFQAAYCSTLRRTLETAQIVLKAAGQESLPVIEKAGFMEAGFGSYESHDKTDMWIKLALFMQYPNPGDIDVDLVSGKLKYGDISITDFTIMLNICTFSQNNIFLLLIFNAHKKG